MARSCSPSSSRSTVPPAHKALGIVTGATLVAAVGFLDDKGWLHHQIKLFIAMPVAAGILLASGIHAQVFEVFVSGRIGYLLDAAFTIFWVVGITASFSILDHMDGLCAGIAAMASIFFAMIAYLNGQTLVTTLAAAVLGGATGFLRWNFKPAKIFMGDGGAMFLGFLMATLGLKLRLEHANHFSGWLVPLFILGVTIFDTTLVTISRSRRGLHALHNPRKRSHRASPCEPRMGPARRRARAVLSRRTHRWRGDSCRPICLQAARSSARQSPCTLMLIGVALLERAPYEPQKRKPA